MSTSVTNVISHFPDCENGFTTTLASTISSGATTVPLNSLAGYTNGEPVVFVVDPSDATKKQTFTGIIDTGGVQVTSVVWTAGTNQSHSGGATVVDYATATHIAMISKGIKVEHNQTGTHSAITADSVTVATGKITTTAVGKLEDMAVPLTTYRTNYLFDFVASGGVWSGDSYGGSLNASMTAMVCYINGRRIAIGAVTARAFTTNVDTYIDVLDNADGTGTLVYTTAATNAASPALASNSIRIGIIQAAATITASTKVNQGEETKVFPVISSTNISVVDSLGNLICPRDPARKNLGTRLATGSLTSLGTSPTLMPGLTLTTIIPTSRKIYVEGYISNGQMSVAGGIVVGLYNSATVTGSPIATANGYMTTSGTGHTFRVSIPITLSGTQSFCIGVNTSTAGSGTIAANATGIVSYIRVSLD